MAHLFDFTDTGSLLFRTEDRDRALFDEQIRNWMPPGSFDFHAHLYDLRMLSPESPERSFRGPVQVGYDVYRQHQQSWMGDRCSTESLFFPFPTPNLDFAAANRFLHDEMTRHATIAGLLLIRPDDDPAAVEERVPSEGWRGFKVYHFYAQGADTFDAYTENFLPEWAWELAHRHDLVIMLHLVRPGALADPANQQYVREHCTRYPNARLVLAHAGRGFRAANTVRGIDALRGLGNVWFDTSGVCEPQAFEAVLRAFGVRRLLYGSDFPISELRGRAISIGDGFWWIYEHEVDWSQWKHGRPTKIGIESLLALQQATRSLGLRDTDVESIFGTNARELLSSSSVPSSVAAATGKGQARYRDARRIIPGGTQLLSKRPEQFAPEQWPPYFEEARGCEVVDMDGRRYLDFSHNGVGSCLLGFNHPRVTAAIVRRVTLGSMCTLNSPDEVALAETLIRFHPWSQQVRFARGGGEAMAIAARIARAATGRDTIAFCGYHGWTDWYLAANLDSDRALDGHLLPGLAPAGVPRGLQGSARPFAYNDLDSLQAIAGECGDRLAAVIMEPTRNVPPAPGFLEAVRALCDRVGAKLVFDEVTTGWRFTAGGVHLRYGIEPDMAVFAKSLGNGHPIAAVLGNAATMEAAQQTFISSTYWTEGVGFAAALATLDVMSATNVPQHVEHIGQRVQDGLRALGRAHNLPLTVRGYPALTHLGFECEQALELGTLFTVRMLGMGFLAGNAFYPTLAHHDGHVDQYLAAADHVFDELADALQKGDVAQRIGGPVRQSGFRRLT